jgi:hypothetical protein
LSSTAPHRCIREADTDQHDRPVTAEPVRNCTMSAPRSECIERLLNPGQVERGHIGKLFGHGRCNCPALAALSTRPGDEHPPPASTPD